MKTVILMFSLMYAVKTVSSTKSEEKCLQEYARCSVPLLYNQKCREVMLVTECIGDVKRVCENQVSPFLDILVDLFVEICNADDKEIKEWKKIEECVLKNYRNVLAEYDITDLLGDQCKASRRIIESICSNMCEKCGKHLKPLCDKLTLLLTRSDQECLEESIVNECLQENDTILLSCRLDTEMKTVGDLFSSVIGFIHCYWQKSEETCGPNAKKQLQRYGEPFIFMMEIGKSIDVVSRIPIPEYQRRIFKCIGDFLFIDELECMDLSNYFGCLADATRGYLKWPNPIVPMFEKYQRMCSIFCDENSVFQENIEKEADCLVEKMSDIFIICYWELRLEIALSGKHSSAAMNFLDCMSISLGEQCSEDAEDIADVLFDPLREVLEETM